ncbi:MAG: hypothetical protein UX99_C0007G0012 [Candidatus Amesbacteria bacterium GW2011_GWB1_47_26]|uniref:Uncharacterized protein n=1 Tax=Candidatus Amesbacteria bacterium GW2011_GWC2_45_19 TaxID=1618366 RepID=A0A0G1Q1H8_9BACT|nr:MAG: hypothetical protein UX05_C0012G0012 [Candidatus Amesbacteria bacterium GW2011_GWC2_45_19]KKU37930.1 MAG: hypothetical protein UX52_C0014G0007 [Candidatus Amesbacteria bacterium GW2011_GWA1_46_35]KKU69038.1 MAG: hypothetical protein UX93_C0003G0030 [Microgenomates group bacterium GW2011_GWC1_47_20]KKU74724.1 MAG: hypothetical protein UX99_C0007G0012 [Candidatus Amesbacteria bacterium GW2011_GWB1_47_26]KKU79771.1 MAG: hypothetical protein UY06_C0014G0012 [Candidatus Amesbacteria bacteriu
MGTVLEQAKKAASVGENIFRPQMLNLNRRSLVERYPVPFLIGAGLIVIGLCNFFGSLLYTTP